MAEVEQYTAEPARETEKRQRRAAAFDAHWLRFSILVLLLIVGGIWFNAQQNVRTLTLAHQQQATALQVSTDQQRETRLVDYLDSISNMLVNDKLLQSQNTDSNRLVATARTLETLHALDPHRKATLMSFLYQTKLLSNDYHIIDMAEADLQGAYMPGIDIRDTYLVGANFSGADLQSANLSFATLVFTNFSKANLAKADLHGSDLHNTNFNGTNLKGANLKDAVGLSNAQIESATRLISGTIMPDGSVHP